MGTVPGSKNNLRSGRAWLAARWSPPHLEDREKAFGVGVEAAGLYTDGDYTSPAGQRDFSYSLGYAAAVLETRIRDFRILPKLGVGYGTFEVEGQMRTLREDGFGGLLGLEGRFAWTEESFDVLGSVDEADVQTHGFLIGMVVQL